MLPVLVRTHGELEDHDRQVRHGLVHVQGPELVVERGEQERRGLPADTRNRKQDARYDPRLRGAHGHKSDHLPLRRAECGRRFAQAIRNQAQHVFGGADHHGDHDQRKRHRPGPGGKMPGVDHIDFIDEKPHHDRRSRKQDIVDEARHRGKPAAAAEFGEINSGHHADRCTDQSSHCGHDQASGDRI